MSDYHEDPYLGGDGDTAYNVVADEVFAERYPDDPWSQDWISRQVISPEES